MIEATPIQVLGIFLGGMWTGLFFVAIGVLIHDRRRPK